MDTRRYVDMTSDPEVGGPVEATFKLGGAYKRSDTKAYLRTVDGYTIKLDGAAKTGSITMGSATYPVSEEAPAGSAGRRLETSPTQPMVVTKTGKQLAEYHLERRRLQEAEGGRQLNMFSGALLTSGSFTMMASSAFRRDRQLAEVEKAVGAEEGRQLNMFAGALLTSGSFTMMASSAF